MNNTLRQDYESAKNFWNTAFAMDDESRKNTESTIDRENGWKQMAPSEKLFEAAHSLGNKERVLDYGCGRGWAAIIAAKGGCTDVTAVEVSENAASAAEFHAKLFGVDKSVAVRHVPEDWLSTVHENSYDGIFCSNVLDVIPEAVSDDILANFARIASEDASVIIGMNYYMEPKDNPEKNMVVKHGNHVYLNDILRLVCRTDEEWSEAFSQYFTVEKLDHFAWPGEETERRRLFYLRKK